MKKWGLVLLLLICFPFIYKGVAQNVSNEGTDFWAVFPSHDPSLDPVTRLPALANITIYVTAKTASFVTVTCGSATPISKSIPANTAVPFVVNRSQAYIDQTEANQDAPYNNRGIRIKVREGYAKVAVYAHIFAGFRSAASLILPVESLGQKYMSMNYTQTLGGNNLLTLVATEDNTSLLISDKGTVKQINFQKAGEVFEYMAVSGRDLTGVTVEVDPSSPDNCNKRFAAFSGSTSVTIGCEGQRDLSWDPLFQQLYPTVSWGKEYGIAPFINRRYIARILAEESNTVVKINGVVTATLGKGEFYTTEEKIEGIFVSASKRVSVAQYSLTQKCSGIDGFLKHGDPEMVLLNPIEFNIKAVTMFSSTAEAIEERYINVIIKTKARNTFRINGALVQNGWKIFPSNPDYSYQQLPITAVSSNLSASEGFNAIAYGFGDAESYAYSAGTNLAANNYLLINNTVTNIDAPNACIDQPSDFKIILPYIAKKISWQLNNEAPIIGSLVYKEVITTSGEIAYQYSLDQDRKFTELRTEQVKVIAEAPNDNDCLVGDIEYNFEFEVYPIPTVDFSLGSLSCPDTELPFTDMSNSNIIDKPINKWLWDFGDGETSTDQNPKHLYKQGGEYTVTLFAGLDDGCMNETVKKIIIAPKINAGFQVAAQGCKDTDLIFTDQSSVASGTLIKWTWDFGDGKTPVVRTSKEPFAYQYTQSGTYTISLVAETANGCVSLVAQHEVIIYDLSTSDFLLPEVCAEDDLATFINKSGDQNGNTAGLTFTWNFGDPGSGAANTSTQVNGSHKYSVAGQYIVTLTVKNTSGCSTILKKDFTVNGMQITAGFDILSPTTTCGNKVIMVKNQSTVNIGVITKIAWYMDVENRPNEAIIDEEPEAGKEYPYLYPNFTTPFPKVVTIRLVAYSGTKCAEIIEKQITLQPSPVLVFDSMPDVCLNIEKMTVMQARETLGVPGQSSLTGPGIGADGKFNPVLAGVGIHTLSFAFTTADGCTDTVRQTITVNPIPILTIDSEIFLLAGGKRKIVASAVGNGLTFKWSPSTGLDRDDVLNPTVTGEEDITYTLTVATAQGCNIVKLIKLSVLQGIKPSNAFSPNGDGANDTWLIEYLETYPDVTVEIFTRQGVRIFYSKGYAEPFDGNFKNEALPVGTYYYIINPNNKKKSITGSLTILR
ncbi:MAG: PKD domain-containing protein [Pedobacter sp.]|nr:MAG: PKD domain-containing protein [Pedobacter sp.]